MKTKGKKANKKPKQSFEKWSSKIKISEYQNDKGYILNVYGYEDLDSKPIKKSHLELYNFQLLFQNFLNIIVYPFLGNLGPVLKWKLRPNDTKQICCLRGPGLSSADGTKINFTSTINC